MLWVYLDNYPIRCSSSFPPPSPLSAAAADCAIICACDCRCWVKVKPPALFLNSRQVLFLRPFPLRKEEDETATGNGGGGGGGAGAGAMRIPTTVMGLNCPREPKAKPKLTMALATVPLPPLSVSRFSLPLTLHYLSQLTPSLQIQMTILNESWLWRFRFTPISKRFRVKLLLGLNLDDAVKKYLWLNLTSKNANDNSIELKRKTQKAKRYKNNK